MSAPGQTEKSSGRADVFRSALDSDRWADILDQRLRAMKIHHSRRRPKKKPPRGGLSHFQSGNLRRVASASQPIDQLFEALRAQAMDAAFIGTDSATSTTGTTLTSFQKVYFEANATMTLGSLASTRT